MLFMVLSSWQAIVKVRPVYLTNAYSALGGRQPYRPSQPTWTVSPPDKAAIIHIHRRHLLLLLSPKRLS